MLRKTISGLLICLQLVVCIPPTHAEYESIYHYYIEEGIEAFYKMDFENAYFYFKTAHAIDPSQERPLQYINLIKRQQEGRVESAVPKPQGNDLFDANLSGPIPTEMMRTELAAEILPEVLRKIFKTSPDEVTDRMIEDAVREVAAQVREDAAKNIPDEIWDDVVRQATVDVILHVEKYLAHQRKLTAGKEEPFVSVKKEIIETQEVPPAIQQLSGTMPVIVPSEKSSFGEKLIRPVSSSQKEMIEKVSFSPGPISEKSPVQSIETIFPSKLKEPFPTKPQETKPVFSVIEKTKIPTTEVKRIETERPEEIPFKYTEKEEIVSAPKLSFEPEKIEAPATAVVTPKESVEEEKPAEQSVQPVAEISTPASSSKPEEPRYVPNTPLVKQVELRPAFVPIGSGNSLMQLRDGQELKLDEALWSKMANLILELKVGESVILIGNNIHRYLSVTEGILDITRINSDRVKVTGVKRGNSIVYIWDIKGRWTLNVHCVYTYASELAKMRKLKEEDARPFRIEYSNSWSTLHHGPSLNKLTRQNLIFTNWAGIFGDTPYGEFDASADTYQFPASTEIVGQTIGLTNAHVGPFDDFSLRGYDASKSLSNLTLQGRYFRGVLLDAYAFRHKLAYSYFRGQDQSISIFVGSSSAVQTKKSYIEGTRVTLNPDEPTKYSLNYVRGWGAARQPEFVKDVFSGQVEHSQKGLNVIGELASDRDHYAATVLSTFERTDFKMNLNLRDIQKNYQTIYGPASGVGQIGSVVNLEWKPGDATIVGYFDLYNDQSLPNEDNPNGVNFDSNMSYSKQIDPLTQWGLSLSYTNDAQIISPRTNAQLSSSYSKTFELPAGRSFTLYTSPAVQWSRYKDVTDADFDRFNLRSGFRASLIRNLSYFFTYDYIWVHDVARDRLSNPWTVDTGLYYSHKFTDKIFMSSNITYHKEHFTSSPFSFLAGEDSVSNNVSLTYRPVGDVQIYLDSQLRRVYPVNANVQPFDEWNLMMGMKAGWDLPFKWNPSGSIRGIVYKDYNGNGLQDKGEPGIARIKVIAGHWETYTNENGEYLVKVRSKKVAVSLDLQTIPQGFVFSTALSREVMIQNDKSVGVNFGLTARSGIYGVAYYDVNNDGIPSRGDKFIANTVVRLDSQEITKTDSSGAYFFDNIKPGKHKVRIDVASIPMDYLPAIKIESEVEVNEGITYVYNIPLKKQAPKPQ